MHLLSNRFSVIFSLACLLLLTNTKAQGQEPNELYPWQADHVVTKPSRVSMCVDKNWMPFEKIDEQGNHVGIAADILKLISQRSGVYFKIVPTDSWKQSLEFSQTGKCQAISFLNKTPEREQWMIFTDPYFVDQDVFISREDHETIEDPVKLTGKTLVLPKHTHVENRIRQEFPNLELILVDSHIEALQWVNDRKADMTLRSLTLAAYIIKNEGWFNLKIAGELPRYTNELRIGILKEFTPLRDTLNSAIATLTAKEIHEITNQYVPIHLGPRYNYRLIAVLTGSFTIVLLVGLLWNYQLRRFNIRLKENQKRLLQVSEKLKVSSMRYKAFIAASNSGAWEYHSANGHLWCSPQYFKMLGRTSNDFDLHSENNAIQIWKQLIHPDDLPGSLEYIHSFIENPVGSYEQIFRMMDIQGDYRWILSRGQRLKDVDTPKGVVIIGTHIDITEQKNAEELILQKNKELETFLYITSHDLRTPLINIDGFGAKIESGLDKLKALLPEHCKNKEEYQEIDEIINTSLPRNLSVVFSNTEKMHTLINGLLTISRAGRIKLTPELCDMNKLIRNIRLTLEFQQEQANSQYTIENLPPCWGDANLLNQLFTNLTDNAIKYRKPGEALMVMIDAIEDESTVTYRIQDNGIGISEPNQKKIWDAFYRVDQNGGQKGDGIGLSVVAKIVERHKGSIWVESKQGEGSTFFVKLNKKKFKAGD